MTDKDPLVIVSGLLQKQDQQAEILSKQSVLIERTNTMLEQFMDLSVKQFEAQQLFNEHQLSFNKSQQESDKSQQHFNERQQDFNERFLAKLDEISNKL